MADGVKQIVDSAATFCKPFDDVHALPPYQCVKTTTKQVAPSLYSRMANAFAMAQTALAVLLFFAPAMARSLIHAGSGSGSSDRSNGAPTSASPPGAYTEMQSQSQSLGAKLLPAEAEQAS